MVKFAKHLDFYYNISLRMMLDFFPRSFTKIYAALYLVTFPLINNIVVGRHTGYNIMRLKFNDRDSLKEKSPLTPLRTSFYIGHSLHIHYSWRGM